MILNSHTDIMSVIPVLDYHSFEFVSPEVTGVTSLAASSQLILVGTASGTLHAMLDTGDTLTGIDLPALKAAVTCISIDATSGAFCYAAGSTGELVAVSGVFSGSPLTSTPPPVPKSHLPIHNLSINPNFSKNDENRKIVCGGATGDLIVVSLIGHPYPIYSVSRTDSPGPILSVKWVGDLLIWCGPKSGVKCLNSRTSKRVFHMAAPLSSNANLTVLTEDLILVISNFSAKILRIADTCEIVQSIDLPSDQFSPNTELGTLMGSDRHRMVGFGLLDQNELSLTLLSVRKNGIFHHVIDTAKRDIPVTDEVATTTSPESVLYTFVVGQTPSAILLDGNKVTKITKRSIGDNSIWLLDQGLVDEALQLSLLSSDVALQRFIANSAVSPLILSGSFERVVALIPRLGLDSPDKWSDYLNKFFSIPDRSDSIQAMRFLVPVLPFPPKNEVLLHSTDYDQIVNILVSNCDSSYLELLRVSRMWPASLFNIPALKDRLIDLIPEDFHLDTAGNNLYLSGGVVGFPSQSRPIDDKRIDRNIALIITLKIMYDHKSRFEDSLDLLMRLGCMSEIFSLLSYHVASNTQVRQWCDINLLSLFQAEPVGASRFFDKQRLLFPTDSVTAELDDHPFLLHMFLRELFERDPILTQKFHDTQVALFSQFDKPLLVDFLKRATQYDPEAALVTIQRERSRKRSLELIQARAYLLWKLKRSREAIELLLDESKDMVSAIEFVASANDASLWPIIQSRVAGNRNDLLTPYLEALLGIKGAQSVRPEDALAEVSTGVHCKDLPSVASKVIMSHRFISRIESKSATILRKDWEKARAVGNGSNVPVRVDPAESLCRICGWKVTAPPPGNDEKMNEIFDTLSSIPRHSGSTLALVSGNQLVHSKCLTRTAVDNFLP